MRVHVTMLVVYVAARVEGVFSSVVCVGHLEGWLGGHNDSG